MANHSESLKERLGQTLLNILEASDEPDPRYLQAALSYLKQFPPEDDTLSANEISPTLAKYSGLPFSQRKDN